MIKGQNPENIKRGNCFSEDGHTGARFDYMLSNPPFDVEWKKVEDAIRKEAKSAGYAGLSCGTVGCTRGPSYPGQKNKPPGELQSLPFPGGYGRIKPMIRCLSGHPVGSNSSRFAGTNAAGWHATAQGGGDDPRAQPSLTYL
jgi:hypothetical protein